MTGKITYTIGIKRRLWPFWKNYTVVGHGLNTDIPGSTRLALRFLDGSVIIIPKFEDVYFKVFPDKIVRDDHDNRLRKTQTPLVMKEEPDAELLG
jgi:hypothetical protein